MSGASLAGASAAVAGAGAWTAVTGGAVHRSETLLFFTLLELAIIVLAARAGGALARRCGQSPAVGEIIVGILLGPSLFGILAPQPFEFVFHSAPPEPLQLLSGIGLVLLMFQIGLEFDFRHLASSSTRGALLRIASASLALPFVLGLGFGLEVAPVLSPGADRLHSALFVATAFSITALPILGRILIEFDLTRTRLGVIAIGAAALNDVAGWLLLALVTALATSKFDLWVFGARIGGVLLFAAVCVRFVRPLLRRLIARSRPRDGELSGNLMGVMLAAIFLAGMTTYQIGIFSIFGGFLLGVVLYDELEFIQAWRVRVGSFVSVFFLPIFFTYTGLRTSIGSLDTAGAWGLCLATIALATLGKWGGAYLAARSAAFGHAEASMLGVMMNTRALMELVVVNVGLDLGVISTRMFTMLVIMAVASTVVTAPTMRYQLRRIAEVTTPARASEEAGQ